MTGYASMTMKPASCSLAQQRVKLTRPAACEDLAQPLTSAITGRLATPALGLWCVDWQQQRSADAQQHWRHQHRSRNDFMEAVIADKSMRKLIGVPATGDKPVWDFVPPGGCCSGKGMPTQYVLPCQRRMVLKELARSGW